MLRLHHAMSNDIRLAANRGMITRLQTTSDMVDDGRFGR
jgi:hypothetical protein